MLEKDGNIVYTYGIEEAEKEAIDKEVFERSDIIICPTPLSKDGNTIFMPYIRANLALNNMEVILTAAECYAREGGTENLAEAARLYNLLRDHRIENNVHVTFANADEALVKVLEERRREFAFLGIYRFVDLKRLNKESRFQKTITHSADGQTWTLPPNDNRYIIPIPPVVNGFRPDLPDYER